MLNGVQVSTSTGNTNKMAMSRALGAAFLNHQVEQLEKSISSNGPTSGNWRDRKYPAPSSGSGKRGPGSPAIKIVSKTKAETKVVPTKERDKDFDRTTSTSPSTRRTSAEDKREKDADIIVVDASVLIHALYQVKKWCKDGRQEVVIVPLEGIRSASHLIIMADKFIIALNTLDLLKKGSSLLAQKARSASRILEAQVGTNPRIRVQRDDAFVLWDKIAFEDATESNPHSCPEWVRRTICCALWATEHPEEELKASARRSFEANDTSHNEEPKPHKVVLAVLSSAPNLSPQSISLRLADMSVSSEPPLAPVPLPAPTVPHTNKHEVRSLGALVTSWGTKAKIQLLEVDPALPGRDEDDRPKRSHLSHGSNRNRRSSGGDHAVAKSGLVERPPAVMAMMGMISQPNRVVRVLARGERLDADP